MRPIFISLAILGAATATPALGQDNSERRDSTKLQLCFVQSSAESVHKRFDYNITYTGSEVDLDYKYDIVAEERGGIVWPQNQNLGHYGDEEAGQIVISAGWPVRLRVVATSTSFREAFKASMSRGDGFLESPTGMYRSSERCTLYASGRVFPESCKIPSC